MCSLTIERVLLLEKVFTGTPEVLLHLLGLLYYRMCSLTIERVLLLEKVFTGTPEVLLHLLGLLKYYHTNYAFTRLPL